MTKLSILRTERVRNLSTDNTTEIWELLERYRQSKQLGPRSVENAFRLASGKLSLVILMQEPCNIADSALYDKMLDKTGNKHDKFTPSAGSPSLSEVDSILRVESHGEVGLQDVSLLDINMLCPASRQTNPNFSEQELEEAQELCLKIVKLIKPQVVLILTCVARRSKLKGIKIFSSSLRAAGSIRRRSLGGGDACHPFVVVKGFHPSTYLRSDYLNNRHWSDEKRRDAKRMLHICFRRSLLQLMDERDQGNDDGFVRRWTAQCE